MLPKTPCRHSKRRSGSAPTSSSSTCKRPATADSSCFTIGPSIEQRAVAGSPASGTWPRSRRLDAGSWFGRPFAQTPVPTLDGVSQGGRRSRRALCRRQGHRPGGPRRCAEAPRAGLAGRRLPERRVPREATGDRSGHPPDAAAAKRGQPGFWGRAGSALRVRHRLVDPLQGTHRPLPCPGNQGLLRCVGFARTVEDYQRAIRDGIDLIQTDHPFRVLRAMELLELNRR